MTHQGADPLDLPIRSLGAGFRAGAWSPREVTTAALERVAQTESAVNAWVLVDAESALAAASQAERELRRGIDKGPMHGVPIGIKDIFDVAGWPTRCGSEARRDAQPAAHDARSVASLREAGAVLLGKTVTQEFAAGVISAPARNPWDPTRIPGGSSGGSAVAVALGACRGAMGSDTGGSIRIPAAACGVVGFKPTYAQIDASGVFPLSWSLDTVGPLARCVDDAWVMWRALLNDRRTDLPPIEARRLDVSGMRIGVPSGFFFEALQPDVAKSVTAAIAALRLLGVQIVEVDWHDAVSARAAAFIINRVETSSVHERTALTQPEQFLLYGQDLRLRVAAGRAIPAALYLEAGRARKLARASMQHLFDNNRLDALAVPSLPTTAVPSDDLTIHDTGLDEGIGAAWTRLTMPFNATGQPVLAVPAGFAEDGLPVGLQLAGRPGRESTLFCLGMALEQSLGLGATRPPLLHEGAQTSNTERING